MFPNPIVRLAFEPTERTFFAASSDDSGTIHQVKLYRRREADGRRTGGFEAVGGGGVDEAIRLDANAERTITVGWVAVLMPTTVVLTSRLTVSPCLRWPFRSMRRA